jgi:hypothetical protein
MKKFIIFVLGLAMLLGVSAPNANAANDYDFCEQYKGVKKIWWDGIELKPGQIGRLIVLKDTTLFKLSGEKKVFSRTLKAGEFYRIYAFKPGMLSVGGGYYVDRDSKVKYETPSKTKLRAVQCIHNPYGSKGNPTVVGDAWDVNVTDWINGKMNYQIGMIEAITDGNVAWDMIKQANMFNPEPPAGQKYVLAKFWVKLIDFEGKTFDYFQVSPVMFEAVSKSGTVYDRYSLVQPQPNLSEIYEGGETVGWVAFLVNENDEPKIVWNRGLEDELWFQLK